MNLNSKDGNNIGFGSASQIYGSSVNIKADGTVTIYGDVTATGNGDNPDEAGSIKITSTGGDVDVYGTLTSAKDGQSVTIPGIAGTADPNWSPVETDNSINDPSAELNTIGDRFAYTTTASNVNGNIIISAGATDGDGKETATGNINLYYGNKENGITTTGGNLTVTATGDVYVDSDLDIGGDLTLKGTGENSEVVLDLTNIGQVQADNGTVTDALTGLHDFMHHFSDAGNEAGHATITLDAKESGDAKLAVDMWNGDTLDLDKYDTTFVNELNNLKATINGEGLGTDNPTSEHTYIWVSNAEQLKNIQNASKDALGYNFALKNDINASDLEGYTAIGGADGEFTGTFDGRGNRIIGLTVENNDPNTNNGNAGIFSTIGENGTVKNLNIYSGNFTSTLRNGNAGTVAGVNKGRIENITAFGNTVTVTGENGNAGGIVGVNTGNGDFDNSGDGASTLNGNGIYDVESVGTVIAGKGAIAGGLVGTNNGALGNSFSNSAVTSSTGTDAGLGGVVGVNEGEVQYVDSLGVTNGGDTGSSNIGGVIGINNGTLHSAYNESIVSGNDKVGGIIGVNGQNDTVTNIVNATGTTGNDYVGGLVGSNSGTVSEGRNNGTITGTNYVGGMVGDNASGAELTDLVNDSSASITGENYVGGIAGSNYGAISATDTNLINRGSITGQQYVGGVAGENWGTIENTNNDVSLNVKDSNATDDEAAKYFGGVTGWNHEKATIGNATNRADVTAEGASYVGGVAGKNDGTLTGFNGNYGNVIGATNVGGVIGENTTDIEGVEAVNNGTVTATAGGAGGIFGVHTGNIIDSTLENTNEVVGNGDGGTGGIATTNSGKITNSTLINEGKVSNSTGNNVGGIFGIKDGGEITGSTISNNGAVVGKENVGGVFGSNSSTIKTSSIYNSTEGMVVGTNNIGGLIGVNTGTIEGGRDEADSYYKYQIYNNGVINVGTWTDVDGDGEYHFRAQAGFNIGGLIGKNEGKLTAGYNTGAINAEGSTNVGGIAGSNSGTIDQVFNTVMVEQGSTQQAAITGGTNVGGLVGNNEGNGTLTNAYNTTAVEGNINVGNAVGFNEGTVQYVYGAVTLVGSGNADDSYEINDSATWLQPDDYDGFNFGADGKWMIYGGSTNPLLSVFLTKVTVVDQHKVNEYFSAKHYGEFQQITAEDINALIALGAISAPDDFDAFKNANGLISGVAGDLGAYTNWLYSGQIASSGSGTAFNPNNLGYDISLIYSPFEADMEQSSRWDYLFSDNPFDRNRNFRERKAEVNFVDGGMEI